MRQKRSSSMLVLAAAALLSFCPAAFGQKANSDIQNIGNREINAGGMRITASDLAADLAMGRQAAREIEQRVRWVQDSVVNEYVNRVGQNLVRNSDAKIPFTIRVVDSDEVNAMALPGGFLFVSKGLILDSDSEEELASVLAHGIAHVAARHTAELAQRGQVGNLASVPVVTDGGMPGMIIQQAAQIGVPLTFLAFTRGAEEEADFLGLQYLYKAGYDPAAMVKFFEKLRAREAGSPKISPLFSTHPATSDRIQQAQRNIAAYLPARAQTAIPPAELEAVKARLAKHPLGEIEPPPSLLR
jgi:beta-barrel assembly-enhancing protease